MASSKLDFPQFLPAPSCRSIVVIRLGSLFKSELRTLLLNSGNPQSSLDHFLNSGLQGSPKFTRARKCWGIETAYRCYEKARPRTAGRNESVRILLMFFPFFLYNAWILAGHFIEESGLGPRGRKRMTFSRFKKFLVRLSTGSALKERPPKRHPPGAG